MRSILSAVPLLIVFSLVLVQSAVVAQTDAAPRASGSVGKIDLTADSSVASPGSVVYVNARLVSTSGATINADEMRANLSASGNQLNNGVFTGHVVAIFTQEDLGRTYKMTADKAVYDPKHNTVDATGTVVVTILTPYTQGPFVQSGPEALIQLGKGPAFPVITMTHVHTVFTPNQ